MDSFNSKYPNLKNIFDHVKTMDNIFDIYDYQIKDYEKKNYKLIILSVRYNYDVVFYTGYECCHLEIHEDDLTNIKQITPNMIVICHVVNDNEKKNK